MFEKEAEELFKNKPLGYEMKPELEIYKDGFNDGYNKANEWHYPSKGEYPKEKGVYLTYRKNGLQLLGFDGSYWVTGIQDDVHNTIIAWKEIVFPELKESE